MTQWWSLIKSVLTTLAKSVLSILGVTATASATDGAIQKKIYALCTATLVFSNEDSNDIIKIVKSLEDAGLFIKDVSEAVGNKEKERKGGFLGMLAATLGASLFGNMLAGKEVMTRTNKRNN